MNKERNGVRYIANENNYVIAVTLGADIVYNDCVCVEYTGTVPYGWKTLEDWYFDEGDKLWRWKIVGGNLEMDPTATAPQEDGMGTPRVHMCTKTFQAGTNIVTFDDLPFLPNVHMYLLIDVSELGRYECGAVASLGVASGELGYKSGGMALCAYHPANSYFGSAPNVRLAGYDDGRFCGRGAVVDGKNTYTIYSMVKGLNYTEDMYFMEGRTYLFALFRCEQGL